MMRSTDRVAAVSIRLEIHWSRRAGSGSGAIIDTTSSRNRSTRTGCILAVREGEAIGRRQQYGRGHLQSASGPGIVLVVAPAAEADIACTTWRLPTPVVEFPHSSGCRRARPQWRR